MNIKTSAALSAVLLFSSLASGESPGTPNRGPTYTDEGLLVLPDDYRNWVYLSTGFDMSYSPQTQAGHHMFDNVFVEPGAYKVFVETGSWPDKTMLVLEARGAHDKGSINKSGNYQSTEIMGLEVHVKDTARFPQQWAFFAFGSKQPAKMIPPAAECYSCHAAHAAVDTTFVQFYPTLLPIAKSKGTLSKSYEHDIESTPQN
jgi:Cytochrome P460